MFFPIVTDRLRLLSPLDGEGQVYKIDASLSVLAADSVVLIRRFVIVRKDGVGRSKFHFIFLKVGDCVVLDGVRDFIAEKSECLLSGGSDVILRVTVGGFKADEIGVREIV